MTARGQAGVKTVSVRARRCHQEKERLANGTGLSLCLRRRDFAAVCLLVG